MSPRMLCVASLTLLLTAGVIRADYVTQTFSLNQSNHLPDGTHYGSVVVEAYDGIGAGGGGLAAGQVRLTFSADALPIYGPLGKNFGLDSVAFNTDLSLTPGQISAPSGWALVAKDKLGGFGTFAWSATASKAKYQSPTVTVLLSGLGADATLSHFLVPTLNGKGNAPAQGSALFAGRVVGFTASAATNDAKAHWTAVQAAPEPSSLALAALALGATACVRRLRRRRNADAADERAAG